MSSNGSEKPKSFLLPGAKRHYGPNLLIVPTHIGFFAPLLLPFFFLPPFFISFFLPSSSSFSLLPSSDIHMEVDFAKKRCQCEVTKTFQSNSHPKTQKLELNAIGFLNLIVTSSTHQPMTSRYDGEVIHLLWEEPFGPNEERIVKFSYTVLEPIDGLFFSTPDEGYPKRPTYVIADHETERARYWLPCVDYPAVSGEKYFFQD